MSIKVIRLKNINKIASNKIKDLVFNLIKSIKKKEIKIKNKIIELNSFEIITPTKDNNIREIIIFILFKSFILEL